MKVLKIILAVIAVVFLLVFGGSLFLSKSYHLERSIEVNAPAESLFSLVGELRTWPEWSPWFEMDPDMRVTYGTTTTGVGGNYHWAGEKAGTGKIEIIAYEPPSDIRYQMTFAGWEDDPSYAAFELRSDGAVTEVTWSFSGEFTGNPIKRYFGLMFETMVGTEYEKGLTNLKALAEAK